MQTRANILGRTGARRGFTYQTERKQKSRSSRPISRLQFRKSNGNRDTSDRGTVSNQAELDLRQEMQSRRRKEKKSADHASASPPSSATAISSATFSEKTTDAPNKENFGYQAQSSSEVGVDLNTRLLDLSIRLPCRNNQILSCTNKMNASCTEEQRYTTKGGRGQRRKIPRNLAFGRANFETQLHFPILQEAKIECDFSSFSGFCFPSFFQIDKKLFRNLPPLSAVPYS